MTLRAGLSYQLIIETAALLADQYGLETLTLTQIAEYLGVRKPSLYNHIGGLSDVQQGLAVFAMQELRIKLSDAAIGLSKRDAIMAIAKAYRRFAHERPGLYRAIVARPNRDNAAVKEAIQKLMHIIAIVLGAYKLNASDSTHALRGLRSLMHGFVSLEAAGWFVQPVERDESYHQLINTFIHGIEALAAERSK